MQRSWVNAGHTEKIYMKAYTVLFHLTLVYILASCEKTVAKQAVDDRLIGRWQWVRTDGGIANNIHETPASTGQQRTLQLNANHTYLVTIGNEVVSQGTFSIDTKTCIHDGQSKPYIRFNNDLAMMVETVDATFLSLSDEANDGTGSQYQRIGVVDPG
ncbi:MAG TPA: hypothetical protein VLC28_11125 [Flavitalea sp.]|nr:hypothetical protein [Flavitalea sp.]